MTNQDPIADREAKIAAWRDYATCETLDHWSDGPHPIAYVLAPHEIDEAVALMRSAPRDGNTKLLDERRAAVLAENARLQADLAAALADQAAMARRELEQLENDLCGPYPDAYQLTRRRLAALPAQQPEPDARADGDAKLRELRDWARDRRAARGVLKTPAAATAFDLQAFATRVLPLKDDEGRVLFVEAIGPVDDHGLPNGVILRITGDMGPGEARHYTMVHPDAATRDGDEVLRRFVEDGSKPGTYTVLAELCRRELARGGK